MNYYRGPHHHGQNSRFIGFGLPFVGGLLGGLLGSALVPRPFYGYPGAYPCVGYPCVGYPGYGFPGAGYPVTGYPGVGYPGYGFPRNY